MDSSKEGLEDLETIDLDPLDIAIDLELIDQAETLEMKRPELPPEWTRGLRVGGSAAALDWSKLERLPR